MNTEIYHSDEEQKNRLMAYNHLLTDAVNKRKNSMSVNVLCDKLNMQRNSIYRIERAEVEPKVSTMMQYLHGFGYHLEIVPDEIKEEKQRCISDFVIECDGISIPIEQLDKKKTKLDKKTRVRLLKYILSLYEEELGDDEDE